MYSDFQLNFLFSDVTAIVDQLESNTTYMIRVASRNIAGISDWLGPKKYSTVAKEPLNQNAANFSTKITVFSLCIAVAFSLGFSRIL